ncbi:MAG: S41 family peptidase [Treponema sp.]|nr:S41 family peptidase [Treponema sp.]
MKNIKILTLIVACALLSACQIFLPSDPDNNPRAIFESIWNEFNKTYALFDIKDIDWDEVYKDFSPRISDTMSERELFDVIAEMLEILDDSHVSLSSPFAHFTGGGWLDTVNMEPFNLEVVKTYLNSGGTATEDEMFLYGTFSSNPRVGYIYIAGFALGLTSVASQDWAMAIDGIVRSLSDTDSLVLDVRGNRGGLIANVNIIASRFVSAQRNYAMIRTKNGPGRNDFSAPATETIRPAGSRYTNPIVLLTNRQTISGGEWFTLALRSQDHVTHVGGRTAGAFSLGLRRSLINSWLYTLSVQIVTDMNGICHEGIGIFPEYAVTNTHEEITLGRDAQLEFAKGYFQ